MGDLRRDVCGSVEAPLIWVVITTSKVLDLTGMKRASLNCKDCKAFVEYTIFEDEVLAWLTWWSNGGARLAGHKPLANEVEDEKHLPVRSAKMTIQKRAKETIGSLIPHKLKGRNRCSLLTVQSTYTGLSKCWSAHLPDEGLVYFHRVCRQCGIETLKSLRVKRRDFILTKPTTPPTTAGTSRVLHVSRPFRPPS